jgi:hypothetical protein
LTNLNNSAFDNLNFAVNQSEPSINLEFSAPGIYNLQTNADRNNLSYSSANLVIVGYDNPYQFELVGNINSDGPGIILEGEIQNFTETIDYIEWTCGSNTQITQDPQVQFPPAGSDNLLQAKVFFNDGTSRIRSIGLGLSNAPKIEDVVYLLETDNSASFTGKIEIELITNGMLYSSKFATEFNSGSPSLTVTNKSLYSDPVTKQKAYLIQAEGLIYFKNSTNNETLPVQLSLQLGLPLEL